MKEKGYSSQRILDSEQKEIYESRFKILLKRNDEEIEKEKEKFKRRMSFQQRLK